MQVGNDNGEIRVQSDANIITSTGLALPPASSISIVPAPTATEYAQMLQRRRSGNGALNQAAAYNTNAAHPSTTSANTSNNSLPTGPVHRIRLVPHLEHPRDIHFNPIVRECREGAAPIMIGRFTDQNGKSAASTNSLTDRIAFKSKVVSRCHAQLWCEVGGKFYVKDTSSSYGTFLNDISLDSHPHLLKDEDMLQFGVNYLGGIKEFHRCIKIRVEIGREWQAGSNLFNANTAVQVDESPNLPSTTSDIPDLTHMLDMKQHEIVFSGTYSAVYKARLGDEFVAVKTLRCVATSMHAMRRKVERERKVWGSLNHPNIVPLLGYADDSLFIGSFGTLISPWYRSGDAGVYLEARGMELKLQQKIDLYRDVVDGVCYLHSHDPVIIHGDLKPGNILIGDDGISRLCDFGLARIVIDQGSSGMTTSSVHIGTDRYTPRELVISQDASYLSEASDVYSLACVGLVFLFQQIPYAKWEHNRFGDISRAIRDGIPPATIPTPILEDEAPLWNILDDSWAHEPSNRPNAFWIRQRLLM